MSHAVKRAIGQRLWSRLRQPAAIPKCRMPAEPSGHHAFPSFVQALSVADQANNELRVSRMEREGLKVKVCVSVCAHALAAARTDFDGVCM